MKLMTIIALFLIGMFMYNLAAQHFS